MYEPIIIESDHDSPPPSISSLSDREFIVSSDQESSSSTDDDDSDDEDVQMGLSYLNKARKRNTVSTKSTTLFRSKQSLPPPPPPRTTTAANLPCLSKLLLLNGVPQVTVITPILPPKPPLVQIQPKPISANNNYQVKRKTFHERIFFDLFVFQMCNTCGCYIYKADFLKHVNEKHLSPNNNSIPSTSLPILNNATNSINNSVTSLPATSRSDPPQKIYLLSTSSLHQQSISLNMIKCPWCDTNVEHIDVMTGHLMR